MNSHSTTMHHAIYYHGYIYLYMPGAMYPHSKNILEHRPEPNGTRNDRPLQ